MTEEQTRLIKRLMETEEFRNPENILDAHSTDPFGWSGGFEPLNGVDHDELRTFLIPSGQGRN